MRKYTLYILPVLLSGIIILEHIGVLDIGYLYIKSHELKWTNLDYNYYPKEGDIFTAGESVTNNNYEDAVLAFNPDYNLLLEKDLHEIALNRKHIDRIERQNLSFYCGDYMVKVCLDKKDISINDSTLFKKIVHVEIIGHYELYDKESCELLYQRFGRKFWIRDKIILRGRAPQPFILNKIEEIWLAQMSNNAHQIISYFEEPYIYRSKIKALNALQLYYGYPGIIDTTRMEGRSRVLLFELNRVKQNHSKGNGYHEDPR